MKIEFYMPHGANAEGVAANGKLQDELLGRYRGFTAIPARGAWRLDNGQIADEPVDVLTIYWPQAKHVTQEFHFLWNIALQYGQDAHQEAVLFVIDGEPHFVFTHANEEVAA